MKVVHQWQSTMTRTWWNLVEMWSKFLVQFESHWSKNFPDLIWLFSYGPSNLLWKYSPNYIIKTSAIFPPETSSMNPTIAGQQFSPTHRWKFALCLNSIPVTAQIPKIRVFGKRCNPATNWKFMKHKFPRGFGKSKNLIWIYPQSRICWEWSWSMDLVHILA